MKSRSNRTRALMQREMLLCTEAQCANENTKKSAEGGAIEEII